MQKNLIFIIIIGAALGFWVYVSKQHASPAVTIPVIVFAEHPALDAARKGVTAVLQEHDIAVEPYNAQGDIAIALQIAKQAAGEEPPVMIGIATPAAQAIYKARNKETTALGFAAVSDPHGAHLDTEANIFGVADTPPIEQLVEAIQKIFPRATRIGVIHNPSEISSTYAIERLKQVIGNTKLKLVVKGVNSASMIKVAAQELIDGGVEIIYVPLDNFMASSLAILNAVTAQQNIPLVANDPALIAQGVTLAVGPDFEASGRQLGEMVIAYLNGTHIEEPIQLSHVQRTVVNKELARKFGIDAFFVTNVIAAELI